MNPGLPDQDVERDDNVSVYSSLLMCLDHHVRNL